LLPAAVLVRVGQEPQLVVLGGPPVQQPGGDEPLQQLVQRPEQRGRPLRVDGQLGDGYALARNAQQLAGARQIPVQKRDRFERQQYAEPRARPLQPADNRRAELVRGDELDAPPDVRVSVEDEAVVPVHVRLVAGVQQGRQVGRHEPHVIVVIVTVRLLLSPVPYQHHHVHDVQCPEGAQDDAGRFQVLALAGRTDQQHRVEAGIVVQLVGKAGDNVIELGAVRHEQQVEQAQLRVVGLVEPVGRRHRWIPLDQHGQMGGGASQDLVD
uniref:Uncharacterized protein n=1 Tax=Anopheles coluzzii TaxID=1518534 RepID=A0A8W7PRA5_ANOCL